MRLVIGFLLIATLAACGTSAATSDPSGSPAPTPVREWATFTSERHGYAVDHPADWRADEEFGAVFVSNLRPFNPGADTITTEEAHRYRTRYGLMVATEPVEPGTSLEEFTASIHRPCGGPSGDRAITLDGERASWGKFTCPDNKAYVQVTALHGDLGYVLWLMTSARPHASERPEYDAIVASFEFTDATATRGDG